MTLFSHQQALLNRNPRKAMLAWNMGTGKTLASIKWAEQNNYNTLVVCPKGLVEQWQQQVRITKGSRTPITKATANRKVRKYTSPWPSG